MEEDFIDSETQTYEEPVSQPEQETYEPEPEVPKPVVSEPEPAVEPTIESNVSKTDMDTELEEMLSKQKAKIKVLGTGGGGNNTINRITEVGIVGAETIAINTDAQDLLYTSADTDCVLSPTTMNTESIRTPIVRNLRDRFL